MNQLNKVRRRGGRDGKISKFSNVLANMRQTVTVSARRCLWVVTKDKADLVYAVKY
jgi:hypothetical protein